MSVANPGPVTSNAFSREHACRFGLLNWVLFSGLMFLFAALGFGSNAAASPASDEFREEVLPLLKRHCFKCHGVSRKEGNLQLHTAVRISTGGDSGAAVVAGHPEMSSLWQRVSSNEMPPENPLTADEKEILRTWILAGAAGLPVDDAEAEAMRRDEHWAFTVLDPADPPAVQQQDRCFTPVDRFIQAELEKVNIQASDLADRNTLIRRVAFTLTGLPPTPQEIRQFSDDTDAHSVERMIDRYLASEQYGVRWGRHWLDAAGYADSNGYFNADSDRPLAYKYRDYVVRSVNADKPFDQFVREQIAGDELSGFKSDAHRRSATPEMIDMLIATHYLRNGQDGSGESDGNPDEVRIDRYTALESTQQIVASSLLGLTLQCAKCHDHKFEPLSQKDFYQLQAVFFPAYNPANWRKPGERVTYASLPGVYDAWEKQISDAKTQLARLQTEQRDWAKQNRLPELVQFADDFTLPETLHEHWTATIPDDDGPAGVSTVSLTTASKPSSDGRVPDQSASVSLPAALAGEGQLKIAEGGLGGDKWLATKQTFDWTPDVEGEWIQVTFSLIDTKLREGDSSAERIAFGIALHDFNNNSSVSGGNILIDGNPAGGASVHLDYPGPQSSHAGNIGSAGYVSGRSFGVRVTHATERRFQLQHIVDGLPDGEAIDLKEGDLPNGSFAFGFCCGRSYVVDDVIVETSSSADSDGARKDAVKSYQDELRMRQERIDGLAEEIPRLQSQEPGRISWLTDIEPTPPDVFLLDRGEYSQPTEKVEPAPLSALNDEQNPMQVQPLPNGVSSSGRRLAWANWVTRRDSRAASLMARVQVNRVWQQHFGTGIVSTPENLGMSGSDPSNQALLDWLADEFMQSGWSLKSLHRMILRSSVFQRSSLANATGMQHDPYNRLLWRYPIRRLDAESVRDAQLAISGDLDLTMEGPYVPTTRNGAAEVIVPEDVPGAFRRSIYLQQRRSQGLSLLSVFDAPTMVTNCTRRPVTTMPLQSLTLLNSDFAVNRGRSFAKRLQKEAETAESRVRLAFLLATGTPCDDQSLQDSLDFIQSQQTLYASGSEATAEAVSLAESRAWSDFCQLLLASNECLYLE